MNEPAHRQSHSPEHSTSLLSCGQEGLEQNPATTATRHETEIDPMNADIPDIPDIARLNELKTMIEAALTLPLAEMTEAEKSKFRQDTWDNRFGPAVARIGNYVIYFDGQQRLSK